MEAMFDNVQNGEYTAFGSAERPHFACWAHLGKPSLKKTIFLLTFVNKDFTPPLVIDEKPLRFGGPVRVFFLLKPSLKRFFINYSDGIIESVEIQNNTVMSNNIFTTANFLLNNNIFYLIYFMDERLQFITGSPDVIPRSLWKSKIGATNL